MKRSVSVAAATLSLLLLSACGGGGSDARKAALTSGDDELIAQPGEAPVVAPTNLECGSSLLNAAWNVTPVSLKDAVTKATAAVVAKVTEVRPGADLVTAEEGREARIPTTEVVLTVNSTLKGLLLPTQSVTLFQTGNACTPMDGDPPYQIGETYLLFLVNAPNQLLRTISPEARFLQLADGTLQSAVSGTAIATELAGKTVQDVAGLVGKLLGSLLPPLGPTTSRP